MRRLRFTALVAALALLGMPAVAGAIPIGLNGDTVTGVQHYDMFPDNYFAVANGGTGDSAVVGAGIEFSTPAFAFPVRADLGNFDLYIIHSATGGGSGANGFTVDLGSLDFFGGATITGVNLLTNDFLQFATLTYSFTGDSIHVDVDPYTHPGTELRAHFEFVTTPVPEPASLLLLGSGLIGAVRAVRKRRG